MLNQKCLVLFITLAFILAAGILAAPEPIKEKPIKKIAVCLQPSGKFDPSLVKQITKGINKLYGQMEVTVLPGQKLPAAAWYQPRKRYRAEKILDHLEEYIPPSYHKIVGLTHKDISTTKGEHKDWGIFGLGSMGGKPCVVSTFRLGRKKVPAGKFKRRLIDVVNHELGHTLGLDHCPHIGCLMEDAKGTIKVVDRSTGKFCENCRKMVTIILGSM